MSIELKRRRLGGSVEDKFEMSHGSKRRQHLSPRDCMDEFGALQTYDSKYTLYRSTLASVLIVLLLTTTFFNVPYGVAGCEDCMNVTTDDLIAEVMEFSKLKQLNLDAISKNSSYEIFSSEMTDDFEVSDRNFSDSSYKNEILPFVYNYSHFIPIGEHSGDYSTYAMTKSKLYNNNKKSFQVNRSKLLKNKFNSSISTDGPVLRLNIKSKKMYQKNQKHISTHEAEKDSRPAMKRRVPTTSAPQIKNTRRSNPSLLTRQFLKNNQRHTTQFVTTQSPLTTPRVRSRMSRDNRRYFQSLEQQQNKQEKGISSRQHQQNIQVNTNNMHTDSTHITESKRTEYRPEYQSGHQGTSHWKPATNDRHWNQSQHSPNIHNSISVSNVHSPSVSRASHGSGSLKSSMTSSSSSAGNAALGRNSNSQTGGSTSRRSSSSAAPQQYPSLPIIQPLQQHSKNKHDLSSKLHREGGKVQLSGSSSSPVQPIKPLLDLGGRGGGVLPQHPVFDEAAPRNLSGLTGSAAYLHCLVHNLANRSVSWIRQRDLHILTVDRYTYTTDERFEVIHSDGSKDWILKIKYAQVRDSGNYECQISTKPVKSYIVRLNVFAPQARIVGAPDMHVDSGSTINLTCVIAHSPEPPAYIFWYHDDKVVNYDSPRGGITVVTERGNVTRGYLLIQDAKTTDSGNYTCAPSNTAPTLVRVHVLNGEMPAAMQTSSAHPRADSRPLLLLLATLLLLHYTTVKLGLRLPHLQTGRLPVNTLVADETNSNDNNTPLYYRRLEHKLQTKLVGVKNLRNSIKVQLQEGTKQACNLCFNHFKPSFQFMFALLRENHCGTPAIKNVVHNRIENDGNSS